LQVCQLRELSSVAGRIARTWAYCVGCLTVLGQVVLATGARAARGGGGCAVGPRRKSWV
jgi:hypothetical protein